MKKIIASIGAACTIALSAVSAFAAEAPDVQTIMSTGMESVKGDLMGILGIAVPILVAVAGAVVAIRFGMKYIKRLGSN